MKELIALLMVATPVGHDAPMTPWPDRQVAQSWTCDASKTCKQIRSCAEARWYLDNCSWGGKLDRDNDGIPCESLC